MSARRSVGGRRPEDGAVAVTTALVLVILVLLAAFLVDLGATRADARTDQLLADSVVMAAAATDQDQDGDSDVDARDQCLTAVEFFQANLGTGVVVTDPASDCAPLPETCHDGPAPPAKTLSATSSPMQVGEYALEVTYPVLPEDAAMAVQTAHENDGGPCDRLKVAVTRSRDYTFGAAGGVAGSGSSANDAVARIHTDGGSEQYATLILLDRTNCRALEASGGSQVLVEDDLVEGYPGLITVDSEGTGSCSGSNGYVMITNGANARICAGVDPADTTAILGGAACSDPGDGAPRIFTPAVPHGTGALPADLSSNRVNPDPVDGEPATRAPGDHEWNCLSGYGTATAAEPYLPVESDIDGCGDGHDPYIQEMASALGDSSDDTFLLAGSWDDTNSGRTCNLSGTVGSPTENVYLDCDTVRISSGNTLRIQAQDYIVVRGDMDVRGRLIVDTGDDLVMVFQDGGLATPGDPDQIVLERTAVYVHQPFEGPDNAININLSKTPLPDGSPTVAWTAPDGPAHSDPDAGVVGECMDLTPANLPSPECFEDLALWTNARNEHILKGLMDVRGVFFTPNAGRTSMTPFDLSGGASQPMRHAQFFSYRLEVSGGSKVVMKPDPSSILPLDDEGVALIR